MADTEITGLSLFTGIGGLDLGVEAALGKLGLRWRPAAYVEREAYPCEVLLARISEGALPPAPIWTDVRTFELHGVVDCIIGGFPCQDLSVAGKRAGIDGERSGLWREFVRIIRELRPRYVFLENVPGLRKYLGRVLGDLAALGFDAEWTSLRASDVGAPHRRKRVFILAHAERPGLEVGRGEPGDARAEQPAAERDRRPAWPPGPDDAWAWVLERWPETQPAICRVADGLPARVDRLRALGNAVVPAQAEAAFLELWRTAHESHDEVRRALCTSAADC